MQQLYLRSHARIFHGESETSRWMFPAAADQTGMREARGTGLPDDFAAPKFAVRSPQPECDPRLKKGSCRNDTKNICVCLRCDFCFSPSPTRGFRARPVHDREFSPTR